ncbi:XrtB/PEP-CTERM-associated transcriptional regulator EpsA [Sulfuriferula sp.]|uniref:XrtB/PEP-CTERM-associated transcriptional regulator EpsA n=1 Tax=Sulfuriferula sp. TaxID=2025307 RepID=UPI0027300460|nr:XrtB/PEP-CTERM-associated transcriptional regulator EpsA [Sulfuriferula sp.]MDP2027806.1 LuxR C-terminal-related transcriptional regulator [Sulfuriferula sp.]
METLETDMPGTHAPGNPLHAIEALLKISRRPHFFQWAQGELQVLFPHEALICCLYGRDGACATVQQFAWRPYFSDDVLYQLFRSQHGVFADLLATWRSAEKPVQLALAEITPRLRMQDGLAVASLTAFTRASIHGVRGHDGNAVSVFVFLNGAAIVDEQHLKLLELVVPHMHGVLVRVLQDENKLLPLASAFSITARERDVLQLIRSGKTNAEIAQILYLSPFTVKNHIKHIFKKLNTTSRSQAVAVALAHGLIDSA